jgi:uncharacterized protein (TIGR00266 family)
MQYKIEGTPFPVVMCELNAGEQIACQSGAMAWMSENMRMRTNAGNNGLGGILSRMVSGESLFQNLYTAEGAPGSIAFSAQAPGEIIAAVISPQKSIVAQKGAYIASELGVHTEIALQKPGAGFFGGDGFVMQKFTGSGIVFLGIDGTTVNYDLAVGEKLIIDTGAFAAAESTVSIDIQMVKGLGNIIAGGEGVFNTTVTGPGRIWLQTMPMSTFAQAIYKILPKGR